MYNEYYLQQILEEQQKTNSNIEDLITEVQTLTEQESGDHFLIQQKVDQKINLLMIPVTIMLLFIFIRSCMK